MTTFGSCSSPRCLFGVIFLALAGCGSTAATNVENSTASGGTSPGGETTFKAEVWADNWSSMFIGETQVMEDSVSITTERSFNQETFTFSAQRPFLINVVIKDFIENDSGLEYIGKPKQQMGDGGYIAQIVDTNTNEVVAVSDSSWKCLTIHEAPLNTDCEHDADPAATCKSNISEAPEGWMSKTFDDSKWPNATEWSAAEVSPKDGYDEISWNASARLIWGSDLKTHNTMLCRKWVK